MAVGELMRKTTGLTPAHRDLIRLLARIAVDEFLMERAADDARERVAERNVAMRRGDA